MFGCVSTCKNSRQTGIKSKAITFPHMTVLLSVGPYTTLIYLLGGVRVTACALLLP